jgi:hypothetical protein
MNLRKLVMLAVVGVVGFAVVLASELYNETPQPDPSIDNNGVSARRVVD